ncbi:MAG: hypothetical protein F4213_18855 [Boseongicola sp. SB0677_bin_26]|nr:hypothetical protein [Boseongicola sp. SB0665_bin_10]MYG28051.1 hypothetical protein [Boseongicola sp. SB0677_bin_26]
MRDGRADWAESAPGRRFPSFGDVLEEIRAHVSPVAIGDAAFARLTDCASGLPAGAASHEFWIELRPHDPERADLIFTLVPGWPPMRAMAPWCRKRPGPAARTFGNFLDRAAAGSLADMPDWMCVELDALAGGSRLGLFAGSPRTSGFASGRKAARSLALVTGTEDSAVVEDWQSGAATVAGFVGPVRGVGSFPEREGAPLRVWAAVDEDDRTSDALERLDWEGDLDTVRALEDAYPFKDRVFLDTDFIERRLGPVTGVERVRPGGWTEMNPGLWAERLRWAADAGWCDRDQADAWISVIGSHVVETDTGPTTLNLGVNHVKFVFGDGDPYLKLYLAGNMGRIRSAA